MEPMPLADLTVIDLTVARAGPTAVRQLADWGADVVRIEPPAKDEALGSQSSDYLNLHRNKRSLALDLKADGGRDVLHRLIGQADVLVENMRAPVKHRLGFDWDTVHALNPGLVMGSISGFGQTGPYAERGGVDQIAQGIGGMMSITGLPGQGPVRAGVAISDVTAGLQLAVGILVALHEREQTGMGRWVHTSLLESMIGMLDFQAARWTIDGVVAPQTGNHHPTLRPMGTYPTADGHLNIAASWGRIWLQFCGALGMPDLPNDERFATSADRDKNQDALDQLIVDALAQRTTAEWVDILNEAGVPSGPVNDISETFADPQVQYLGVAAPMVHPTHGEMHVIRNATNIEGVSNEIRSPTPTAGAQSVQVLEQFGFDAAAIDGLVESGVIGTSSASATD